MSRGFSCGGMLFTRTPIIVLLCIVCGCSCFAQSFRTIVLKNAVGEVVAGVSVWMMVNQDVISRKTDTHGKFYYNPDTCLNVKVKIKSKIYEDIDTTISTKPQELIIKLKDRTQRLNEVSVVAYRRIAKEDAEKSVFSIDLSGMRKNTKADIALRFLPDVMALNDQYTIVGKSLPARVKIDGQAVSAQDLKLLNAEDIVRVEVRNVTREDDGRFSGEINIIRKRRTERRFFGNVSSWVGLIQPGISGSAHLEFQDKYWEVSGIISLTRTRQNVDTRVDRVYTQNEAHSKESMSMLKKSTVGQEWERLKVSYVPDSKWNFTLYVSRTHDPLDGTDYVNNFDRSYLERPNKEVIENYDAYANVGYKLSGNKRLVVRGKFQRYKYSNLFSSQPQLDYCSTMREYTGEAMMEIDKVKMIRNGAFTYGFKNIIRQNVIRGMAGTLYSLQQLFATTSVPFSKSFSAYFILKGEGDNQRDKYFFSFQPTVRINYNLAKKGNLAASYQRSITRPSIDYLNTDTLFVSDIEKSVGNASLCSQSSDVYSLSYSRQIKKTYFTFTASYQYTRDLIDKAYETVGDYNVSTYENVANCEKWMFSVSVSRRVLKNKLNLSASFTGTYVRHNLYDVFETKTLDIPTKGWGCSAFLNVSYLSTKGWMYLFSGQYFPRTLSLNTIYRKRPSLLGSVSKNFLHDHIEVSLSFMSPFKCLWRNRVDYQFRNMAQQVRRCNDGSDVSVGLVWNFGKKFKARKTAGNIKNTDIILRSR